jgi:predicted  nucleic acid-binding Zn-ribbon protein
MSTTPITPEPKETDRDTTLSTPRWVPIAFAILFVLLGYMLYAGVTARRALEADLAQAKGKAEQMATQLDQANSRIAELKGRLDVTSEKLGLTAGELARARALAQSIRKEQKASDEQLLAQIGQVRQESESKMGQISGELTGAKSDIESTRKDLEATKIKLDRTVGDLGVQSGLIARNREELEEVKRRGERNIYDFELRKNKKKWERIGPIQVQLRDANPKKYRYTVAVMIDDKPVERRDKALYEPVQFSTRGMRVAYELVVFQIAKDRAVGYLSTPKEVASR